MDETQLKELVIEYMNNRETISQLQRDIVGTFHTIQLGEVSWGTEELERLGNELKNLSDKQSKLRKVFCGNGLKIQDNQEEGFDPVALANEL